MDDIKSVLSTKMEAAGRSNEMTFKFKLMHTDELRVTMAMNVMEVFKIIPPTKCKVKNSNISIDLRNEANRIFTSSKNDVDKLMKAWELYSKSIATAPNKSEELSLAYANRSALLFCLKKYTECLEDIEQALELDYPHHLKGKILCRKLECMYFLNNIVNANNIIEEAKCWLRNINLSNYKKDHFQEKLSLIESKIALPVPLIINKKRKKRDFSNLVFNKLIPCATDALIVKYNKTFGRHVVTTRKINAGEILIVEKPYATMLKPEEVYTHCSHCLQVYWALIPCQFCIYAMYCSHKCKNEAWKQYHDVECSITGYLIDLGFNKCTLFSMRLSILALRELKSVENLKNYLDKVDNDKEFYKNHFNGNEIFQSDKYHSIYTLMTNAEKRTINDLFDRALNAAFILYYLYKYTNLLGQNSDFNINQLIMNENATFIGGLILRNIQIISSNIHSYEEERRIDTIDIGASALPFCSLINHSCDPNVSRCSTKDYMIIYAIVPIEEGLQIFDNYGSHYAVMAKNQREQKLKQYYFTCECRACKENWPTYENLLPYNEIITNNENKKKIESAIEKLIIFVDYAKEDNIENKPYLLTDISKMIETIMKYVSMPCSTVNNVIETLKRVFALTYGNKFEIPKLK